ncbi:hypothetical protein AJ80_03418 [Polytolypa hystricis UAMH7299]|uniref:DUF3824 domain-containing protein n=1 Tax=Polytolypa hystricis (strain UAMH7299) TaxID=1447883 RepID=A0A2B7YIB2_POLH7|nr:hypothetical protein AJ80_03418 [Polytolypa hystricis UAMH7299]
MASYYADHPYQTNARPYSTGGVHHPAHTDPVRHPQDPSEDSYVEEIQREFPPPMHRPGYGGPSGDYSYDRHRNQGDPRRRRARSADGRRGDYSSPREEYYQPRHRRHGSRRDDNRPRRRRSHSSSSESRTPSPRPRRRKSLGEQAMAAVGLGKSSHSSSSRRHDKDRRRDDYDRDYDRDHDRDYDKDGSRSHRRHGRSQSSHSPSRSGPDNRDQILQTLKAALTAGAAEAYRARKEPGGWTGKKGKRVLTAAIGAGGAEKLIDANSSSDKHSKRHLIESTLAGLATNRVVNGPRSRSRSRGRNQSGSHGVKDLAAGGILAAAGKEAYNHFRSSKSSKSRRREERSGYSSSSESSPPRHRGTKKRSQSVSGYVSKGLAALGLDDSPRDKHRSRRRDHSPPSEDDYPDGHRPRRHRSPDKYSRDSRDVGPSISPTQAAGGMHTAPPYVYQPQYQNSPPYHSTTSPPSFSSSDSDSDLGHSSDDERTHKKLTRRELLSTGFATVATIHAGHSIYRSINKREKRKRQLRTGEITPEQARKDRTKNNLKDAASLGVTALGVTSAVSGWQRAARQLQELDSFRTEAKYRAKKRAFVRENGSSSRRSHSVGDGVRRSLTMPSPAMKYTEDRPRY